MRWHWQYLVFLLSVILNVDFILIPVLKKAGLSGINLFFICLPISTIEIFVWYWFFRFFQKIAVLEISQKLAKNSHIKEAVDLGKEVHWYLKDVGLWDRILNWGLNKWKAITHPDNRILKRIKRGGHGVMFFLGWEPWFAGGRTLGVICCATTGWRRGLYTLSAGNVIHIAVMVGIWSLIFNLGSWKAAFLFIGGFLLISLIARIIKRKRAR